MVSRSGTGHADPQACPFSPQPKPTRTRRQDERRRRRALERVDLEENIKVHKRSRNRCELRRLVFPAVGDSRTLQCCFSPATAVHHFIRGSGRRSRRESAMARNKIHVCQACHDFLDHNPQSFTFDPSDAFGTLQVLA